MLIYSPNSLLANWGQRVYQAAESRWAVVALR
jgi:hypothetical protein